MHAFYSLPELGRCFLASKRRPPLSPHGIQVFAAPGLLLVVEGIGDGPASGVGGVDHVSFPFLRSYVESLTTLARRTNRVFSRVARGLPDIEAIAGTLCCGLPGPVCPLT